MKNFVACIAFISAALAPASDAPGQEFPAKAVRFMVPFAAGGPNDLAIRPLAQKLHEVLGQPMVVDYRAGANGAIGTELVAKAPPDGYTLLVISSSFSINPAMTAKLPYDPIRDFAVVGSIATSDIFFVVNRSVPAQTVKEFVAVAKSRPGKVTYGSSGSGGSLHLGAELLSLAAGIQMVHVPYKGAILALTDVIGGHVDTMFVASAAAIPQIRAGKVRALAVASKRRAPGLPDVPTFAEAGYPAVGVDSRYGILAPAATPKDIIVRLNAAMAKALAAADVRERYAALGLEAAASTPQDYAAYISEDLAKWRKVVAAAKLQIQQ